MGNRSSIRQEISVDNIKQKIPVNVLSIDNANISHIRHNNTGSMTVYPLKGQVCENISVIIPLAETEPVYNLEKKSCVICLEREVKTAIVDCGHACLCVKCARELGLKGIYGCPKCRRPITRIIRLYEE